MFTRRDPQRHVHTHTCTHTHAHTSTETHTHTQRCMHTQAHAHTGTGTYPHAEGYMHTQAYTHMHTQTRTHTHKHIHNTHMCRSMCISMTSLVVQLVKNPTANAGGARDTSLIPGSGRSPGEGNGNTLQYSCLENPTNRVAWRATIHGLAESDTS